MKNLLTIILFSCFTIMTLSCENQKPVTVQLSQKDNEAECRQVLQTLLKSIEDKDIDALISTMSPKGNMELILTATKPSTTTEEFITFHRKWFKSTGWSMETDILSLKVDGNLGVATTSAMYREALRDGKPYFNNMIVSYVLDKIDGKWYVTRDQANSIEKTKS